MQQPTNKTALAETTKPKKMAASRLKKMFVQWLASAAAGVSMLGLIRALAPFLGYTIKINTASLGVASLLGVPGMILILLLRIVLGWG